MSYYVMSCLKHRVQDDAQVLKGFHLGSRAAIKYSRRVSLLSCSKNKVQNSSDAHEKQTTEDVI